MQGTPWVPGPAQLESQVKRGPKWTVRSCLGCLVWLLLAAIVSGIIVYGCSAT